MQKFKLIEQFIEEKGIEVVLGFNRDPVFGHALTFDLGGVFVEVIKDISTRVLLYNYTKRFGVDVSKFDDMNYSRWRA